MSRYIDATDITKQIADFKKTVNSPNSDYMTGYLSALSVTEGMIANTPTADVAPIADTVRKIIEYIATLLEANWNDIQHGSYWLTNGCCIPLRELLKNVEKKYVEEENND